MSGKTLLSKILFLQDFPTLIGSAFAFVAKLEFSVKLTSATFLSPKRTWELSKNIKKTYMGWKLAGKLGVGKMNQIILTSNTWFSIHHIGENTLFLQKVRNFIFDHLEMGGRGTINQSWCRSLLCTWASPPLTSLISFKQSFNKVNLFCLLSCVFTLCYLM